MPDFCCLVAIVLFFFIHFLLLFINFFSFFSSAPKESFSLVHLVVQAFYCWFSLRLLFIIMLYFLMCPQVLFFLLLTPFLLCFLSYHIFNVLHVKNHAWFHFLKMQRVSFYLMCLDLNLKVFLLPHSNLCFSFYLYYTLSLILCYRVFWSSLLLLPFIPK